MVLARDSHDKRAYLDNLGYFAEWGGRSWHALLREAFRDFIGEDLTGQRVLDIGTRYGKMSCLFALLGAEVVGIDINGHSLKIAQSEAVHWAVTDRVLFVRYDGSLDIFASCSFDLVFTKSVLVLIENLDEFLQQISSKLRPAGKAVFLENGKGSSLLHGLRRFRHRRWNYSQANYFTESQIAQIRGVFDVHLVKKTLWPPVYLVCGHNKRSMMGSQ
ncbi:MAG: class I SAM-dependent methyltransferase [Calditrichaeota bacterium]|nr:class I SAM-dependent methyltransferase [Calditrichota bacterium]